MIFAAGKGTRLRPITDHLPKALVEVNGVPMLERVIRKLKRFGYSQIMVNVHYLADQIEDFLALNQNFGIDIHISDERDLLLETGGGLKKVRDFFDKAPFLVHNVDVLSDIDIGAMREFHLHSQALATMAVRKRHSSRYLLFDGENHLCGWKNVKTQEEIIARKKRGVLAELAFSGIHVIDPSFFSYLDQEGPFSIIPSYLQAAQDQAIMGFVHQEGRWLDIGKPEQLAEAASLFPENEVDR